MSTPIHQEVTFKTSKQRLYDALLDSGQFGQLSGAPADIDATAGGAFTCFGGKVTGRNIELHPHHRIIQAWRVGNWPEGVYSIIRFDLADVAGDTRLTFSQDGFPDEAREHLDGGWHKMYWEPLRKFLS